MPEESAVALGVAALRVLEVAHRLVRHEEGQQRAGALHTPEGHEPVLEQVGPALEVVVDGGIAQAP